MPTRRSGDRGDDSRAARSDPAPARPEPAREEPRAARRRRSSARGRRRGRGARQRRVGSGRRARDRRRPPTTRRRAPRAGSAARSRRAPSLRRAGPGEGFEERWSRLRLGPSLPHRRSRMRAGEARHLPAPPACLRTGQAACALRRRVRRVSPDRASLCGRIEPRLRRAGPRPGAPASGRIGPSGGMSCSSSPVSTTASS